MDNGTLTTLLMADRDMPCLFHDSAFNPPDILIHNDVHPRLWSPDVKRFNAVIEYTWDHNQDICRVYIQILGEEKEPKEEVPQWVESSNPLAEGHPEQEREEAIVRRIFGLLSRP